MQLFRRLQILLSSSAVFLPVLAFSIHTIFGKSVFVSMDDVVNLLMVSGGYTGVPEFQNYIQGPIFGFVVSSLYRLTDAVAWYPLFVLGIPSVLSVLLLREIRSRSSSVIFWQFNFVLTSMMLYLGSRINYTFGAFISCGMMVLLVMLRVLAGRVRIRDYVTPVLLGLLALSLRTTYPRPFFFIPEAFLFSFGVGFLCLVSLVGRSGCGKILRFVGVIGVVYVLAWVPSLYVMRSDPGWAKYQDSLHAFAKAYNPTFVHEYFDRGPWIDNLLTETGLEPSDVAEMFNTFTVDAVSVPNEKYERLTSVAWNSYVQDRGILGVRYRELLNSLHLLIHPGVLLTFVISAFSFWSPKQSKLQLWRFLKAGLMTLVVPSFCFGYVTAYHSPSYVLAGSSAVIMIFLLSIAINGESSLVVRAKSNVRKIGLRLVLLVFASWLAFGGHAADTTRNENTEPGLSANMRQKLLESRRSNSPVIHERQIIDFAYRIHPFDTSIPMDYLYSRDYSVLSFARSPQAVRRWNYLTGEKQTVKSLFYDSIYDRVVFDESRKDFFLDQILIYRDPCVAMKVNELGYYKKVVGPCRSMVAGRAGYQDSETNWFSEPNGFLFTPRWLHPVTKFELQLLSPFGEYAKVHDVLLRRTDAEGNVIREEIVQVQPGTGTNVLFRDFVRGQALFVISTSPCVVPNEVDPNKFADMRPLCVGVGTVAVDGKQIALKDLLP